MIDYYPVCNTHRLRGPAVWRCIDPDELRWFLVEHHASRGGDGPGDCDVRIVSENDQRVELVADGGYERWVKPPD